MTTILLVFMLTVLCFHVVFWSLVLSGWLTFIVVSDWILAQVFHHRAWQLTLGNECKEIQDNAP
jgi:hypothetical protein